MQKINTLAWSPCMKVQATDTEKAHATHELAWNDDHVLPRFTTSFVGRKAGSPLH